MPFSKGHKGLRKHYTPRVESVCSVCGKVELRRPCEVSPYCGSDCYHRSRAGVRPKEITKPCAQCGKRMTDYVSQIGTYCSRACADAAKRIDPSRRFWKRVKQTDGCWPWRGGIGTDGYGKFWIDGTTKHASRVAYELSYGPITDDTMQVCHHCDNPLCVRPDHLFLGTRRDNSEDMVQKGRSAAGERSGIAKLTAADVLMIRAAWKAGVPGVTIAARFGMSTSQVSAIVRHKSWRHID